MYHDLTVLGAECADNAVRPTHPAPAAHPFHAQLWQETRGLHRYALRLSRDEHAAQDLVQETLAKAWANRDRFTPGTNLRAWLNTILRNTFLNDIRKRRWEIEDADGVLTAGLSDPPPQEHRVALSELLAAMTTLPPWQRAALTLVGAEGFSTAEAAERLGCANGTVKSRVSRARKALCVILLEDQPGVRRTPAAADPRRAAPASAPGDEHPQDGAIASPS